MRAASPLTGKPRRELTCVFLIIDKAVARLTLFIIFATLIGIDPTIARKKAREYPQPSIA
jgi:hypothetical protein